MKNKKVKRIVLYTLLVLVLTTIFIFSGEPGKKSESTSDAFTSIIIDKVSSITNKDIKETKKKDKFKNDIIEPIEYIDKEKMTKEEINYYNKKFISETNVICLNLEHKTITSFIESDSPFTPNEPYKLSSEEIKAITLKCSELGW